MVHPTAGRWAMAAGGAEKIVTFLPLPTTATTAATTVERTALPAGAVGTMVAAVLAGPAMWAATIWLLQPTPPTPQSAGSVCSCRCQSWMERVGLAIVHSHTAICCLPPASTHLLGAST